LPELPLHNRYALHIAAVCAEAALRAYPAEENHPQFVGWPNEVRFGENHADGILLYDDATVLVSISGTKGIDDWVSNLRVAGLSCGQFVVSEGIWRYAVLAMQDMLESIADMPENPCATRPVIYCGHSLGGGAALVAWLAIKHLLTHDRYKRKRFRKLSFDHFIPHRIVTFGAPRCITGASAALFPWPTLHVRMVGDIVPSLPIEWMFNRSHIGRTVWVSNNGHISGYPRVLDGTRAMLWWLFHGLSMRSIRIRHDKHIYAKSLNRFLTQPNWETAIFQAN
jgi:hypothetical protein